MKYYTLFLLLLSLVTAAVAQDAADTSAAVADKEVSQLHELIYNHIRYPAIAQKAGFSGVVKVDFNVLPNGQIANVQADFLGSDTEVARHSDDLVVLSKRLGLDTTLNEQALFSLQAESLLLMQRMRQLAPSRRAGQAVLSSRSVRLRYTLE